MNANNGKRKFQLSILEFTTTKTADSGCSNPDIIDLTIENDLSNMVDSIILCPICNVDLTSIYPAARDRHVELCLLRDTTAPKVAAKKVKLLALEKQRKSYINTPERAVKSEKSKSKSSGVKIEATSIEMAAYSAVNSIKSESVDAFTEVKMEETMSIDTTDTSLSTDLDFPVIEPPKSVNPSKGRKPIPKLKILSFPIDSSRHYEISVDAFNYAPHPTIKQYILTHFHSDHYGGISKKWSYERVFEDDDYSNHEKYKRIIYCTEITGRLLTLKFKVDPRFIMAMEFDKRYVIKSFDGEEVEAGGQISESENPGLYATPITANHCPGAAIFLFESIDINHEKHYTLHCGDFRVNMEIMNHPALRQFSINGGDKLLNKVYLDTTYMSPQYTFPKQEDVCDTVTQMFQDLIDESDKKSLMSTWFGILKQRRITDYMSKSTTKKRKFLILVGTYLIGKEKLAISILKRLQCPIYILKINSRDDKPQIIKMYQDEYLDKVVTENDIGDETCECVVHLVPMHIVGTIKELSNYFNHNKYFEHFERCVGLRPTGWSFVSRWSKYKPDFSDDGANLVLLLDTMKLCQPYSYTENILPQSPVSKPVSKTKGAPESTLYRIYSIPYSEHSSYRELSYFCIFLNIDSIIPTVNTENHQSAQDMASIIRLWELARAVKQNKSTSKVHPSVYNAIASITLDDF